MTPRKPTPIKGMDTKGTSHVQNIGARETVQQLIAFASTILVYPIESEGRLFNEEWVKFLSCWAQYIPYVSANISLSTEDNHRLTRILDSIANISISQAKGEVVAVAVQISMIDIRLIVSSNGTLPDSTIRYLNEIWNTLKRLSKDYQDYHRVPENAVSPKRPSTKDLGEDAQIRIQSLGQEILRFGHGRLRRRVAKHYLEFISLNKDVTKELKLESVITQLKRIKPWLDQPALGDTIWDYIWTILEHIRVQFDEFSDIVKSYENTPLIPFHLTRYLSKVVSVNRDIQALMKAANSPRLRTLFHRDFQIINLKGSGDIPFSLPTSRAGWAQLVEDTLRWRNTVAKAKGELKFKLDKTSVQQHAIKMCETPPRNTNFVHCELNVISYILQSLEGGFLDYIGVSKLCCRGCAQCILAVEHVLGKRFRVKGTHQKFYYPWAFPNLPHASSVAERMRNTISFVFGQTYKGFYPETKEFLSDSESTMSSGNEDRREVEGCYTWDQAMSGLLDAPSASENTDSDSRRKKRRRSQK